MASPNIPLLSEIPNTHVPGSGTIEVALARPATVEALQALATAQALTALDRLTSVADPALLPRLEERGGGKDNTPANPPLPKRTPREDGDGVEEKIKRLKEIGGDTDTETGEQ